GGLEVDAREGHAAQGPGRVPGNIVRIQDAILRRRHAHGVGARSQHDVGPREEVVGIGLRADDCAVNGQLDGAEIGVNSDVGQVARPVAVAATFDVQDGIARPVGLVPIEGVFAYIAIVGNQDFIIANRSIAFVAFYGCDIILVTNDLYIDARS